MEDLGLQARSLFLAGRAALLPTAADRARVSVALSTRFGIPIDSLPHEIVDEEPAPRWLDGVAPVATALRRTS